MAKTKSYRVLRSFAAKSKDDGVALFVTREMEDKLPDILTAAALKAHVDAGNLEEVTDGE